MRDGILKDATQQRIGRTQETLFALRQELGKLMQALEMQQSALGRLYKVYEEEKPSPAQEKALRGTMAFFMAVDVFRHQIEEALTQHEKSLQEIAANLAAQLKRQQQVTALAKSAEVINSTLDLGEVLNQVMDMLISLTQTERGFLMLLNETTGKLEYKVARNLDRETLVGPSFDISRTIVKTVFREGTALITTKAQADPRFSVQESVISYSLRSILCVPLKAKGRVIGVIYADTRFKVGLFTQADRDLLIAFADQASVAIENARLFESVTVAKNLMQNVFASITSGVVTTDKEDLITLFNRAAETILGLPADRCLHQPYREALAPLGGALPRLVESVKDKQEAIVAYELEPSDLPERSQATLSLNLAPLKSANKEPLGVAIVLEDLTEKKRFARERQMIRRYLPAELVDVLADLKELRLGGARQEVSILFADIRGFSTYSEQHDPIQVVDAINTYFGLAHVAIQTHRGIVDKYMGDAVLAHFNTPLLPLEDHAWRALRAAWEIKQRIEEFHATIPAVDRLQFGIGVNTGEAVAGNVGASDRMEYTLIGDAVNLAKRLQENAVSQQILVGQRTYELVKERVWVNKLPPLQVKGRTALEQVYELVGIK